MRVAKYQKVNDERKRRIRGLWRRNGWFYARLTIVDETTGLKSNRRVRLEGARTVAEARNALQDLQKDRRDHTLPVLKRSPKLADYWDEYFKFYAQARDAKRLATIRREKSSRKRWNQHLRDVRLNEITRAKINGFIASRQKAGVSPRTVNLDIISLRNVLKRAVDDGYLKTLPTQNLRPLKVNQKKRALVTPEQMEAVFAAAARLPRAGQQLADCLRLMCAAGSRIAETLRLRWGDVDFKRRQLSIGADGLAKNRKPRVVDFNAELERHLKDMASRRAPDSDCLFPSPRRGEKDIPIVNFNKALYAVHAMEEVPKIGFHDCRHFFTSHCVMAGIDYMTIAKWVGHQDGGVLIGKIYGHLSNEHARRQADKLVLKPVPASTSDNSGN